MVAAISVCTTIVDGRVLMHERRVLAVDEVQVLEVTERVSKVVPEVKVSNLLRSMAKDGRKFSDLPAQPIKV